MEKTLRPFVSYRMAAADTSTAAADFAYEILTRDGHRSWLEMLAHNATMTTEHWFGTFTGANQGHTWSHPWSAAPARIIPQFLMGVRPIERCASASAFSKFLFKIVTLPRQTDR